MLVAVLLMVKKSELFVNEIFVFIKVSKIN